MRILEGLQLTEELRNTLTESQQSQGHQQTGTWLTECRWRDLVHTRRQAGVTAVGWAQPLPRHGLGQLGQSLFSELWLLPLPLYP